MNVVNSVRQEAAEILYRVFQKGAYADILLDDMRKKCSFSNPDSALLSELVHGTIRWKGRLDYWLKYVYHGSWKKLPVKIRILLELGLYQLVYLDRVPDFAAIHETVQLVRSWGGGSYWTGTVNAILRRLASEYAEIKFPNREKDAVYSISSEYSHPEWLVDEWVKSFGPDRAVSICRANNEKPIISIRVNCLKSDPFKIHRFLNDHGYFPVQGKFLNEFMSISNAKGLFETDLFQQGNFTIQDESAGLPVMLLNPKPGETILDVAAAPGGKTGYIIEKSKGRANIIAMDRHYGRLQRLSQTLDRLDHDVVHVIQADGRFLPLKSADKILVDAPCSGIGVLRKRAELRWRIHPDQFKILAKIQKAMLKEAAECIGKNGVIVYSTCTLIKQENQEIVSWFLKEHPRFVIEPADQWIPSDLVSDDGWIETWPDLHQIDGSFAVRFKKE